MSQGKWVYGAIAAVALSQLVAVPKTEAASINLTPAYPDLFTSSASLAYTYVAVCERPSNGTISTCGGQFTLPRWDLTYGRLVVTKNGSQILNPEGTGTIGVTDNNGASNNYSLTVVLGFNATGTALSGILASDPWSGDTLYTSSLAANGTTTDPNFQSGTIVTGTPVNATGYGFAYPFGYSGSGAAGTFEFIFNNVGGDFAQYGPVGGIIMSTFNLTGAVGNWDSLGVTFWKTAHSGTVNVDTFVPVPAAVWLMGSALMGLFGIRLTRQRTDV
jgi:hypothetical protein